MRSFLLGLVTGIFVFPLLFAGGAGIWIWLRQRPPSIQEGSVLVLELQGNLPERPQAAFPWQDAPLTIFEIWDVLRRAKADPRISEIVLKPEKPDAGWAKLSEIQGGIEAFRQSGRKVTAFLRSPNVRDYYLATSADRIVVPPEDFVDLKGLRAELLYARGALDKLGIVPEFIAIGKYKDAPETLTERSSSGTTREVVNEFLDSRLRFLVRAIARSRKKSEQEVRELLDRGPFLASDALATGLVDETGFEVVPDEPAKSRRISAMDYSRATRYEKPAIAFLVASGDIARGSLGLLADELLSPAEFIELVRRVRKDESIRAVVLRIDSPGGDAIASDEMLHELRQLAAKKPVIVSMSDVAASAGYSIALAGSPLIAYPETVTGSIGIFFGKLNLTGLYDKVGIHKEVLQRGRFAAIDSEAVPLTPEAQAKLENMLRQMYKSFVEDVAKARNRSYQQIDDVAQGRVWLGSKAREHGLVDELGGISAAIEAAKRRGGLTGDVPIRVLPDRPGFVEALQKRTQFLTRGIAVPSGWMLLKRMPSYPK